MNLRPLNTKVYIEEIKDDGVKTDSGIILHGNIAKDTQRAIVLAIGPEVEGVAVGEAVYPIWSLVAETKKVNGKRRGMIDVESILAVDEDYKAS